MNKNIFAPYADVLRDIVNKGQRHTHLQKGFSQARNFSDTSSLLEALQPLGSVADRSLFNKLQGINSPIAAPKYDNSSMALGSHPDFAHLRSEQIQIEKHYITTVFIDIRNSTRLFDIYEPEVVTAITIAVQRLALHICWYFGGYIHRLQGDGLMVYFGGKQTTREDSVQQALHAASFFSYFIKYDLKNILSGLMVERALYTRIGIDFGNDEDVVWHQAGIGRCSEITTCSLHTSLAAKMQSSAESNGIVVGDYAKQRAPKEAMYFSIIKDSSGKEDRYIFQGSDGFLYTQWKFNWWQFLLNHPDVEVDTEGNLRYKPLQQQAKPTKPETAYLLPGVTGYKPFGNA